MMPGMVFNQKPTDADSAKFGSSERFGRGLNALNIAVAFAQTAVIDFTASRSFLRKLGAADVGSINL